MNSRLLPIVALLGAIGIFFAFVRPLWIGPIAGMKASIDADDKALAAAQQYVTQQNALLAEKNAIDQNDIGRVTAFLPNAAGNVGLILDLNALAAQAGLSLSDIDIAARDLAVDNRNTAIDILTAEQSSPISSADLSLSAVGTYESFQKFLRSLEKSERLLDVRDLLITGSNTGVYSYSMVIRFYWLH